MRGHRQTLRDLGLLLLILCVASALLAPLLDAGFVTDDFHLIHIANVSVDNEAGISSHDIGVFLEYFWLQASPRFELYRPSVLLSFGLNSAWGGTDPWVFQITNLLLHLLATTLVFFLVRALLPGLGILATGGAVLLFAISPLQLEVVAWSAARSETLSLIFGSAALLSKIKKPKRVLLPLALVALALTAKESALAFLPSLLLLEFRHQRESRTFLGKLGAAAAPPIALFLLYALLRLALFGRIFGAYGHKGVHDYLQASDYALNVMQSISVLGVPCSFIVFGESFWKTPIVLISLLGIAALGAQFLTPQGRKRDIGGYGWLGSLLVVCPLLLGVLVNPVTHFLVGTRALYTPLAGLVICLACGMKRSVGWLRFLPLSCLLLIALLTNRASQEPHIQTAQSIRATLASLQDPLRNSIVPNHDRIGILGYQEQKFFEGSFDMSNGLRMALQKPFVARNHELMKVSCLPGTEVETISLSDCLLSTGDGLVLFSMESDDEGRHTCSLISTGAYSSTPQAMVSLRHPRHGGELILRPDDGSTPHLSFIGRGLRNPSTMTLTIINCNGAFPGFRRPLLSLRSESESNGTLWHFDIPEKWFPPSITGRTELGWSVEIHDRDGNLLARSPVGCLILKLTP